MSPSVVSTRAVIRATGGASGGAGAWEYPRVGATSSATELSNRYISRIGSLLIGAGIWTDLAVDTEPPRPPRTTATTNNGNSLFYIRRINGSGTERPELRFFCFER